MDVPRATPDDAVALALAGLERQLRDEHTMMTEKIEALDRFVNRVFDEHRDALTVAEAEREKTAVNVRHALEDGVKAGDARLEDHITHQVEQVRQGLSSLQSILQERDGRMDDRFNAHREAIQKAEDALNKRLEAMNGFHAQAREQAATFATRESLEGAIRQMGLLVDRNREDIADQRGVNLTLAAHEQIVSEWTAWRNKVDVRDAEQQNHTISRRTLEDILAPIIENVNAMQKWQFKIAGALVLITVILPGITAFAVYLLTRHAVPVDNGLAK